MHITHPTVSNAVVVADQASGALSGALLRYGMTVTYCAALCFAYQILSQFWDYFGFTYKLTEPNLLIGVCLISALPVLLLDPHPNNFGKCAGWFIYLLVYIPSMLVPIMQFYASWSHLYFLYFCTFAGCVLFLGLLRKDIKRIKLPEMSPKLFWPIIFAIWGAIALLVMITFSGSLQFVGMDDIYIQRFAGSDVISSNAIARYGIALLASAIDPFLIGAGLYTRRYWMVGLGAIGQIMLFGTLAARSVILSPMFVVGVYLLGDRQHCLRGSTLMAGLLGLVAVTLPFMLTYDPLAGIMNQLLSLLYLRTFLISGALFGIYDQFFTNNPLTYFSYNNLISIFVHYPYGNLNVGQVVMTYIVPDAGLDLGELNASFLATDGISALGPLGVPFASVLAAILLRLMSRFIQEDKTVLMTATGTGFILSMANTSVLTALITGGGIILVCLIGVAPLKRHKYNSSSSQVRKP